MSKVRPIGGTFEDDLESERESPLDSVSVPDAFVKAFENAPAAILDPTIDAAVDLFKEIVGTNEDKKKFESKGEIKDFHNPGKKEEGGSKKAEAQLAHMRAKIVEQEEVIVAQQEKIKKSKETARIVGAGLSGEEKKTLLHVSLDYAEEHIDNPYHMVNLRQKLREQMEEKEKAEEAQKSQEVPRGKGNGIDMNKVAEGGQSQLSTTGGGGIG